MYDVIVVGGGPAGSVAAKKCVEHGLKTLLLEKRKLPRDKVCSGMVMGPLAKNIISQEFGELTRDVLVAPYYLAGYVFHVPGAEPQRIEYETPISWRRDLDYWMNQKAMEAGVEVRDGAQVTAVVQQGNECTVMLKKTAAQRELKARFVVGADGATSVVRKSLFPELQPKYTQAYRECYEGELALDKKYWQLFFPFGYGPFFGVIHKGECFVVEGKLKQLRNEIRHTLADYGYDPDKKPLWQDGCPSRPGLHHELFSSSFLPAKGNVLLAGDAAVLKIFISGEGIGTALKCGVLAADAIIRAIEGKESAATIYLRELQPLIAIIRSHYPSIGKVEEEASKGPQAAVKALKAAYEESLTVE